MKTPTFLLKIENSIKNIKRYKNDLLKNREQIEGWTGWLKEHNWEDLEKWIDEKTSNEVEKYILIERTKLFYNKWENYDFEEKINELDKELEKLNLAHKKALLKYKEWEIAKEFE